MTTTTSALEAAELIQTAYERPADLPAARHLSIQGAEGHVLRDGTLVIPGTNQRSDWLNYNFQVHVQPQMRIEWLTMVPRAQLKYWHMGFMRHAENLLRHLPRPPTRIVGHSLGGAAAQILGCHFGVPTITFGAPRVYNRKARRRNEAHIICYCRDDDRVGRVPTRVTGFRQLGHLAEIRPRRRNLGEDHRIDKYIEVLNDPVCMEGIALDWPLLPARA